MAYFSDIANQVGISLWLLVVIFIWSYLWKLLAFWKSAKKNHLAWFIVFAIVNTLGILEILYIYVFSERTFKTKKSKNTGKEQKTPKARKKRK